MKPRTSGNMRRKANQACVIYHVLQRKWTNRLIASLFLLKIFKSYFWSNVKEPKVSFEQKLDRTERAIKRPRGKITRLCAMLAHINAHSMTFSSSSLVPSSALRGEFSPSWTESVISPNDCPTRWQSNGFHAYAPSSPYSRIIKVSFLPYRSKA